MLQLSALYKELGFFERLISMERDFPGTNVILHKNGVLPDVSIFLFCLNLNISCFQYI